MKIEYFEANWDTVIIRFFLMMGAIIGGIFAGQYWLAALGLPLFLSAIMGVKITKNEKKEAKMSIIKFRDRKTKRQAA